MTKIKEWSFQGSEQLLKSDFPEWIQNIPTLNYSDYFGVWVYSEDSEVIPLIRSRVYLKLPNGKNNKCRTCCMASPKRTPNR